MIYQYLEEIMNYHQKITGYLVLVGTGLFGFASHLTSPAGTHSVLRFEAKRI